MKPLTAARAARTRRIALALDVARARETISVLGLHPTFDLIPKTRLPLRYRTDPTFVVDRIIRPARRIVDRLDLVGSFHREAARAAREPKE